MKFIKNINLCKVLLIFAVGFVSRCLINDVFDINVFIEYCNIVSLSYYSLMSIFTVYINQLELSFINILEFFKTKHLCMEGNPSSNIGNNVIGYNTGNNLGGSSTGNNIGGSNTGNNLDGNNVGSSSSSSSSSTGNNVAGSSRGNNVAGSSTGNNDEYILYEYDPSIGEYIKNRYGVCQPDNSKGNLTRFEQAQQLDKYIHHVMEYNKSLKPGKRVPLTKLGLTEDNQIFLAKVIRSNPGTMPHKYFVGPTGRSTRFASVNVTKQFREILKNVR